jgi:hypothetical protein
MRIFQVCAASSLAISLCSGPCLGGDDTDPKVSPMRLEDVADAPGSPFPRFDNFSWRAFIALNWPALTDVAHRGEPDNSKKLGDPGPRVWETYKARYEVFSPGAPQPADWDSYKGSNPCGSAVDNQTKTLSSYSHYADYNQAAAALEKLANPLVAQNRVYTRYEVRFNKQEFDSIRDNQWYIKQKLPTAQSPGTFNDGSIEIKAAWRILNAKDTPAVRQRFYVSKALVLDPLASEQTGSVVCNPQDIALVGFHIVIKTKLRPQWIWSSFEHVDNVPPVGTGDAREPDAKDVPAPYSYNSGKQPQALPLPPPKSISQKNKPDPDPAPMQLVRQPVVWDETMARNKAYWELPEIKGTVWANYMLVMTQWPKTPGKPAINNPGDPFPTPQNHLGPVPTTLANTTMETYQQDNSCMACHQDVSNKFGQDFVAFMVFDATDPPQQAIARAALRPAGAGKGAKVLAAKVARSTAGAELDNDPSIKALVKFMQSRAPK